MIIREIVFNSAEIAVVALVLVRQEPAQACASALLQVALFTASVESGGAGASAEDDDAGAAGELHELLSLFLALTLLLNAHGLSPVSWPRA